MTSPFIVLTDMFRYTDPHRESGLSLGVLLYPNGRMITDMCLDGDWFAVDETQIVDTDKDESQNMGSLLVYRIVFG